MWSGSGGLSLGLRRQEAGQWWVEFHRYIDGRLIPVHKFSLSDRRPEAWPLGRLEPRGQDSDQLMLHMGYGALRYGYLLDGVTCDEDSCLLTSISGNSLVTNWSPDGRHGLVNREIGQIWLVDQEGDFLREIGYGISARWLDNERYAFLPLSTDRSRDGKLVWELVIGYLDDEIPVWTIKPNELLAAEAGDHLWTFQSIMPNPARPDSLILMASTGDAITGPSYLFLLRLDTTDLKPTHLPLTVRYLLRSPLLAPDGRWLTRIGLTDEQMAMAIELINLDTLESWQTHWPEYAVITFSGLRLQETWGESPLNWSLDNNWLAVLYGGIVHLLNPEMGQYVTLAPPQPGCTALAWLP